MTVARRVSCVDKGIYARLEMAHYFAGAGVGGYATRCVREGALRVDTFSKEDHVETAAGCPNFDVTVGHREGVVALIKSVILTVARLLRAGRTAAARRG